MILLLIDLNDDDEKKNVFLSNLNLKTEVFNHIFGLLDVINGKYNTRSAIDISEADMN